MARNRPSRDDAPVPRYREPPGPIPTLAELRRETCWLRMICPACGHERPTALAPLIIRFGPQASSDVVRRSARCTACGGRGAVLMHPSWIDIRVGFAPFPG